MSRRKKKTARPPRQRFVLQRPATVRRVVGTSLTMLVGGIGACVVPVRVVGLASELLRHAAPSDPVPHALMFVGLASFVGAVLLLGRVLDRIGKLTLPGGTLAIGSDGFVHEPSGAFTPWGAVHLVSVSKGRATLHLHDGASFSPLSDAPAEVVAALKKAWAAHHSAPRLPVPPELANAEDREAFFRGVRTLGEGDYREATSPDALLQVVEDTHAPPISRVGAALALKQMGQSMVRVRVAMDGSADEALRAALASAMEGELEASDVKRLTRR